MTVEEKLKSMLVECGMFENQADDVLVRVQADEAHEAMLGRWNEPADNYPEQLYLVLWMAVKDAALAWIDENCPRAWFRPMFADNA